MTPVAEEILKAGVADFVGVLEVESLAQTTPTLSPRATAQAAVREVVLAHFATIGDPTQGGFRDWLMTPFDALGKLEDHWNRVDWSPGSTAVVTALPYLRLNPEGRILGEQLRDEAERRHRAVVVELARLHPAVSGRLELPADIGRLHLSDIGQEVAGGAPPRYRAALAEAELGSVLSSIDRIYGNADAKTRALIFVQVLEDCLYDPDLARKTFPKLGPNLREALESFLKAIEVS